MTQSRNYIGQGSIWIETVNLKFFESNANYIRDIFAAARQSSSSLSLLDREGG